jgi:hypothetical protein
MATIQHVPETTALATGAPGTFPPVQVLPQTRGSRVSRREVVERALRWIENRIPFDARSSVPEFVQSGHPYRADSSGFVSMAWRLPSSLSSRILEQNAPCTRIQIQSLLPGDAVLYPRKHVVLFHSWTSADKTSFHALEESRAFGCISSVRSASAQGRFSCRFARIFDEPLDSVHQSVMERFLANAAIEGAGEDADADDGSS